VSDQQNAATPTGETAAGSGLAAALAKFQRVHQTVSLQGTVTGGPREGDKYVDLNAILKVCSKGTDFGLCHHGEPRVLGETLLVYREVLKHVSGEQIYAEIPIPIENKGQIGQIMQGRGSGVTYARKYCLMSLYGLAGGSGDDPDATSYSDASRPVVAVRPDADATVQRVAETFAKAMDADTVVLPNGVAIQQQQNPAATAPQRDPNSPLTPEENETCVSICRDQEKGAGIKKDFLEKFYPNYKGRFERSMFNIFAHLDFLTLCKSGVPF
jgi:hypothetical protein